MSKTQKKISPSKEKEYVKMYNAEWYAKNRKKHLETMALKMYCDCGSTFCKSKFNRHITSEKHKRYELENPYEKKCNCGSHYKLHDHYVHMKCKKHQQYLEEIHS